MHGFPPIDGFTAPAGATRILVEEHEVILAGLRVLEAVADRVESGADLPPGAAWTVIDFIRLYADRCHHAKEEGVLFPAMEAAGMPRDGGPIGMMLREHDIGREYVRRMAEAVAAFPEDGARRRFAEAARDFSELLQQHIFKENNILFRMAEEILGDREQQEVRERFGRHEAAAMEPGQKEKLRAAVEELGRQLA